MSKNKKYFYTQNECPCKKISFLGRKVRAVDVVQIDKQTDKQTDIPRTDQRLKTYEFFFSIFIFISSLAV